MSRTYTVDGVTYHGFNQSVNQGPHILILVQNEDVLEPWFMDPVVDHNTNTRVSAELWDKFILFLYKNYPLSKVVGMYDERGFRGVLCPNVFVSPLSRFAN